MRIADLVPIDQEHAKRAQFTNATGTPRRHTIPQHRFKIGSYPRHGGIIQGEDEMAKSAKSVEDKKKTEKKTEAKPQTWGSKEMANRLKVDAKRLRTILRASGKGLEGSEEGRYSWKPNDEAAISKVKKIVDEYEAAAKARKEKAAENKKAEAAPKKKGKKAAGKKKAAEAEDEEEEVFEEEEEETEE
jgi:hypothetical protein